jgi:TolB-like protein
VRKQVQARLYQLVRAQIDAEVKQAAAREAALEPEDAGEGRIAVFEFRNLGSPYFDPIGRGLAEMMITDLSQVRSLQVVERIRTRRLLEERGLAASGLTGPDAAETGRLLGSGTVVSGAFVDLDRETLQIEAALAGTHGQRRDTTETAVGPINRLFELEKRLVFSLIDQLGLALSQQERDAIQKIPTENPLAFMAYCRGLEHEDSGRIAPALGEYEKAAALDSSFTAARQKFSQLETVTDYRSTLQELDASFLQAEGRDPARYALPVRGHLLHMGSLLQAGLMPGPDRRKPATEGSSFPFGNSANFEIIVPLGQASAGGE